MKTKQSGFTLVELAISLMIIGLLLGGVLKGEELVSNARATAAAKNLQEFKSAVAAFRSTYEALPGDMKSPSTRLPNCSTAPCSNGGNADGRIGTSVTSIWDQLQQNDTAEYSRFWRHLVAADMIVATVNDKLASGIYGLKTPFGGSTMYHAAFVDMTPMYGNYITLGAIFSGQTYAQVGGGGAASMTGLAAYQIDAKIDDGLPQSGDVISPSTPYTACMSSGVYNLANKSTVLCVVSYKITKWPL